MGFGPPHEKRRKLDDRARQVAPKFSTYVPNHLSGYGKGKGRYGSRRSDSDSDESTGSRPRKAPGGLGPDNRNCDIITHQLHHGKPDIQALARAALELESDSDEEDARDEERRKRSEALRQNREMRAYAREKAFLVSGSTEGDAASAGDFADAKSQSEHTFYDASEGVESQVEGDAAVSADRLVASRTASANARPGDNRNGNDNEKRSEDSRSELAREGEERVLSEMGG